MALPKKSKFDINLDPPKVGSEYLKYGFDRIEQLMRDTDTNTNFLPRTIEFQNIDQAINDYVENGELKLIIEGENVPTFYLENERWGEFSKTWKFMDGDKNVPTPYITVRRTKKENGTRLGTQWRIPQGKAFMYLDVPILDEGQIIMLRFKIPEPTNIDFTYEVSLFTKYRVDVNAFDETMFPNFASRQGYIFPKGHPMPVHLESVDEANTVENIDGDRFYVSKYVLKVLGYIQKEEEFEITKTSRMPRFGINLTK
jgi:hypothetical protein